MAADSCCVYSDAIDRLARHQQPLWLRLQELAPNPKNPAAEDRKSAGEVMGQILGMHLDLVGLAVGLAVDQEAGLEAGQEAGQEALALLENSLVAQRADTSAA